MNLYEFYNKPQDLISWNKHDPENTGKAEFKNGQGQYHREDGPAVETTSGHKEWYLNGELHREDGPAVIGPGGTEMWYLNGELHREDGPARIFPSGNTQYWVDGTEYSEKMWKQITKN